MSEAIQFRDASWCSSLFCFCFGGGRKRETYDPLAVLLAPYTKNTVTQTNAVGGGMAVATEVMRVRLFRDVSLARAVGY